VDLDDAEGASDVVSAHAARETAIRLHEVTANEPKVRVLFASAKRLELDVDFVCVDAVDPPALRLWVLRYVEDDTRQRLHLAVNPKRVLD
jgi:hypothetical protein